MKYSADSVVCASLQLSAMEHSQIPGPSSMHLVTTMVEDDVFDPMICIICQEVDKSPVTSEKTGRARIKRAASVRNDVVTKRIKSVVTYDEDDIDDGMFVYHNSNKCYKSYTHSGKLKSIEEQYARVEHMVHDTEDDASTSDGLRKTLRGGVAPRAPPSCDKDPRLLPCVICANVTKNKCREKFRICEYDSAKKLTEAAKHNQDEVFTRIADRLRDDEGDCVKSVISADLYCHNLCRQNYMRKYERDINSEAVEKPVITNIKRVLFTRALPYIDKLLVKGECCTMT